MEKYHNTHDSPQISSTVLNDSDPKYMGKMETKKAMKKAW